MLEKHGRFGTPDGPARSRSYTVTHDSDRTDAKVVVINTCGFIGDAKQESIDMILRPPPPNRR